MKQKRCFNIFKELGHEYKRNKHFKVFVYLDVDFARVVDKMTFTSGYLMRIGSVVVSLSCKKQVKLKIL